MLCWAAIYTYNDTQTRMLVLGAVSPTELKEAVRDYIISSACGLIQASAMEAAKRKPFEDMVCTFDSLSLSWMLGGGLSVYLSLYVSVNLCVCVSVFRCLGGTRARL